MRNLALQISETDTVTLLEIPSLCVWSFDERLTDEVSNSNTRYAKVLSEKGAKDIYASSGAQTFNNLTKSRDIQVHPPTSRERATQASTWDIYDASREVEESKTQDEIIDQSVAVEEGADDQDEAATESTKPKDPKADVFSSDAFALAIRTMEQVAIQNTMHTKHLMYCGHTSENFLSQSESEARPEARDLLDPVESKPFSPKEGALELLWTYQLEDGHAPCSVTCMDYNRASPVSHIHFVRHNLHRI
jgi:hypothetical protein